MSQRSFKSLLIFKNTWKIRYEDHEENEEVLKHLSQKHTQPFLTVHKSAHKNMTGESL